MRLPAPAPNVRTVADVLVETLVAFGITHVFGMVGHSNLGFADAMRRAEERGQLTYTGIGHEGAASFAASAYGKLTGAVTAAARAAGVPVVAVVGGVGAGHESAGLGDIAVASEGVSLEEAMARPLPLVERAAERLVRAHATAGPRD